MFSRTCTSEMPRPEAAEQLVAGSFIHVLASVYSWPAACTAWASGQLVELSLSLRSSR